MRISLGVDERWFSISIESNAHPWASGGTHDILSAIKVLETWQRGVSLQQLNTLFPFMHYEDLAEARELGDPVATQWRRILAEGDPFFPQMLLHKINSDDHLRRLFPFLSHGTLRLARDYSDRTAGEIWITPLRTGEYEVKSTTPGEPQKVIERFDQVVDAAIAFLNRP
ncbi:DUF6193 family natural product biosynthesis protein [Streptomyces lydicus]|uniref:DUF6193 family natural product biosynthesis protein n=1 Tax=Streptomyces lydicus TaxID=47763 RepID=UPI00379A5016